MRVCFYTLGCKVNLNETEALEQLFRRSGFTVVPDGQPADVYIVNSCTVTNFGDQKSRKWLRHAKRENPGAVTVLTGCYPQAFPEQAAGLLEADLVCGNTDRRAILDHVMQLLNGHERIVAVTPHTRGEAFEEMPVDRFETHTRAFIKVEDGCNRRCAYCIIPKARGPVRSRPISSILAELRQLAGAGYREVVLSAISLPSYGTDTGTDLYELVEQCAGVEGIQRIRLGSLDPDMLTPEGIRRLAAVDKLCPQFHLSLQSGCDATLRRMRRPYTTAQYLDVVRQLRQAYAGRPVSFTTDCICGFPGESEEDFVRSCGFLEEVGFLRVHVFPGGHPGLRFPPAGPRAGKAGPQPPDARPGRGGPPRRAGRPGRLRGPGAAGDPRLGHRLHRLYPAVCAGQRVGAGLCRRGYRAGAAGPLRRRPGPGGVPGPGLRQDGFTLWIRYFLDRFFGLSLFKGRKMC